MKIKNLFRIESNSYTSDLKKEELKTELINGFNLNHKRDFKSFFKKENSDYQGTINEFKFNIRQNNSLSSINDGIYFFFTQISGEIIDNGNQRTLKVNAELSEGIIGIILGSIPIYILIMIFGNLWVGVICFLFLVFIYLFAIKNVKSDFEIFEKYLKQKTTVYNNA